MPPMALRNRKVAMTCEEFQAQISEWTSDGVDIDDIMLHPHAQKCGLCMELLRDLGLIAEQAERQFGGGYLN